jgi:hypothetical protein
VSKAVTWLLFGPLGASVVLATAGWIPTIANSGQLGATAMLVAIGLVLVAVYGTIWWSCLRLPRAPLPSRLVLALRANIVRFFGVLAGTLVIAKATALPLRVLLIWVAIAYVVLIKLETALLLRWLRTLGAR